MLRAMDDDDEMLVGDADSPQQTAAANQDFRTWITCGVVFIVILALCWSGR